MSDKDLVGSDPTNTETPVETATTVQIHANGEVIIAPTTMPAVLTTSDGSVNVEADGSAMVVRQVERTSRFLVEVPLHMQVELHSGADPKFGVGYNRADFTDHRPK